jgi:hypothetical protein
MPGLDPGIHAFLDMAPKDVDGRAFAALKRLRPRRRDKPGHDDGGTSVPTSVAVKCGNLSLAESVAARNRLTAAFQKTGPDTGRR